MTRKRRGKWFSRTREAVVPPIWKVNLIRSESRCPIHSRQCVSRWCAYAGRFVQTRAQESDQFYIMDAGSKWGTFLKISPGPTVFEVPKPAAAVDMSDRQKRNKLQQ